MHQSCSGYAADCRIRRWIRAAAFRGMLDGMIWYHCSIDTTEHTRYVRVTCNILAPLRRGTYKMATPQQSMKKRRAGPPGARPQTCQSTGAMSPAILALLPQAILSLSLQQRFALD